ncbi:DUF4998 domain-containing protein [Flavobacterium flavipallidum]|uniref:DUF4998 domain-containing protein n=1 Tax=Flavobacterium flavipallidum TaxID=3139140 RepID=A0ABU9HKE9_9FLAO
MNKIEKYIFPSIILLLITAGLWSCSSIDDTYKDFIKDGEVSYTGKIDSLHVYGGRNRVNIKGLIISDPKVSEVRVFWNTHKDSVVVPITRTSGIDELDVVINDLDENIYNFEVRTYDKLGNKSVPVYVIGNVYGERYEASLTAAIMNRNIAVGINSGVNLDGNLAALNDLTAKSSYSILKYTATDDSEKELIMPINQSDFKISDFKAGTNVKYKTVYLPEEGAIDSFFTPESLFAPQVDVTSLYVVNAGFETNPLGPTAAFVGVVDGIYAVPGWSTNTPPGTNLTTNGVASNKPIEYKKLAPVLYNSTYNTAGNVFGTTPQITQTGGSGLLAVKEHWLPSPVELYAQQVITLPIGKYTLVWNSLVSQTATGASSLMGYEMDGLPIYDSYSTALNVWKTHSLVFTVTTPKSVIIRMGYKKTANAGGGGSPILFMDNIILLRSDL